jgi:adsorption protein B
VGNGLAALGDLLDRGILWTLVPLGIYILFTGLDDLFIDIVWLYFSLRDVFFGRPRVTLPREEDLSACPEKRIAIFVPLWREHQVIGQMLAHNIAAIRYQGYDFFVGAYPNDGPTLDVVRAAEARFPNVHLAVCPHDGPTSKADCLNWIYQRMLLFEESRSVRFDVMMTHDAEDIIHKDSLRWVNYYSDEYGFVQIPVLALSTPPLNFTHGVYCDEFAEFQTRDLPVRNFLGGFLPSAGVGTSYSREALEALANSASNRIFEPVCLTEDYENGFRLHGLGIRQLFVPITFRDSFIATREYFPRQMRAAIRQRTRWTTGIALQGWERHGWRGGPGQLYWLWRDRKGLLANPVSLITNAVCAYGVVTQIWNRITPPRYLLNLLVATFAMQIVRISVRIGCTARVYGFAFSLLAPARVVVANLINSAAVVKAIYRYSRSRLRGEALVWVKTEHAYPSRSALIAQRRFLGEILVGSAYVDQEDLDAALATQPAGTRLGEHLIAMGKLSEEELYEALSLQQHLPLAIVDAGAVPLRVARSLPAHIAKQWKVLPFRIEAGRLDVASPELPVVAMETALRGHTSLEVRFHLITPLRFRELQERSV